MGIDPGRGDIGMAQNITTLLEKSEITAAEIRSLESTVDNFLYLVHGTGST